MKWTIDKAIKKMEQLKEKFGPDVEVKVRHMGDDCDLDDIFITAPTEKNPHFNAVIF